MTLEDPMEKGFSDDGGHVDTVAELCYEDGSMIDDITCDAEVGKHGDALCDAEEREDDAISNGMSTSIVFEDSVDQDSGIIDEDEDEEGTETAENKHDDDVSTYDYVIVRENGEGNGANLSDLQDPSSVVNSNQGIDTDSTLELEERYQEDTLEEIWNNEGEESLEEGKNEADIDAAGAEVPTEQTLSLPLEQQQEHEERTRSAIGAQHAYQDDGNDSNMSQHEDESIETLCNEERSEQETGCEMQPGKQEEIFPLGDQCTEGEGDKKHECEKYTMKDEQTEGKVEEDQVIDTLEKDQEEDKAEGAQEEQEAQDTQEEEQATDAVAIENLGMNISPLNDSSKENDRIKQRIETCTKQLKGEISPPASAKASEKEQREGTIQDASIHKRISVKTLRRPSIPRRGIFIARECIRCVKVDFSIAVRWGGGGGHM